MSINWKKSADLNNMTVEELKIYFDKFPGSGRKVVAICDGDRNCPERVVNKYAYSDLCMSCAQKKAHRTPESRKIQSNASKKMYRDDPTVKERISDGLKKTHKEDPTISQRMSESHKKRYEDPDERRRTGEAGKEARDKDPDITRRQGVSIKKTHDDHPELWETEAMRHSSDKQRGGNDIVKHHYIYDYNDLIKYTIEVTRSEHQKIHRTLQKAMLEVPCINIMVDD